MNQEDQIKRENIPDPATIKTAYHPVRSLIMVQMLPDVDKIGTIYLPRDNSIRADACEGHVVRKGPKVSDEIQEGDCICFEKNLASNFTTDEGGEFTLVPETAVVLRIPRETLIESKAKREAEAQS